MHIGAGHLGKLLVNHPRLPSLDFARLIEVLLSLGSEYARTVPRFERCTYIAHHTRMLMWLCFQGSCLIA